MMRNNVKFRTLRRFLLDIGFSETVLPSEIVFQHKPSDTLFVFRPYRPDDLVANYNLAEVESMLDSRGLMSADAFVNQFKRARA
jgi:hypothetical protein